MPYPWDMTSNEGFVNGYGFPDGPRATPSLSDRARDSGPTGSWHLEPWVTAI